MDFQEFIKPELLILIPVLYLIGVGIKKSKISDKHIPWILGLAGIILSVVYLFATEDVIGSKALASAIFTAITQGILCAGASVYVNQIIKQAKDKEKEKE